MLGDVIAIIRTSLQCSHGEGVAQRMWCRTRLPPFARQTDFAGSGVECGFDIAQPQRLSMQGDKEMRIIEGRLMTSPFEIAFEVRLGGVIAERGGSCEISSIESPAHRQ